ncbi:MAG: hypothetical protein J0I61_15035 [Bosea sp.]|nr:hypothetical protein [Bosea sp. (in: a-proteobacteria)]
MATLSTRNQPVMAPAILSGPELEARRELRDLRAAYALIAEVVHGLSLQPKFSLDGGCDEFNEAGVELDDLRIRLEARGNAIARMLGEC